MDCEAATLAYSLENEVGETLRVVDGFYDCGRGWGPTMANIGVQSLLELFVREGAVRGREVVLIDARSDASLALFRQRVLRQLKDFTRRKGCSALKLAALLAKLVAERLGGHGEIHGARVASGSSADVRRVREANGGSDIIPLGSVRLGVCRHRAALFKYLADAFATSFTDALPEALRLRTRLVRGRFDGNNRSVGHAWNLVWSPKHASWFVIDVMHDPNAAFEENSDAAQKYNTVAIEQSTKRSAAEEKEAAGEAPEMPARVCPESVAALGAQRLAQSKTLHTKHADQSWLCSTHRLRALSSTSRPQSFLFCPACFRRKTKIEQEREGEEALFSGPEVTSGVLGRHVVQAPLQSTDAWWAAAADGRSAPLCDGPHRASRGPPRSANRKELVMKYLNSAKWLQARAICSWNLRAGAIVAEDCLFDEGDTVYLVDGGYKTDEELQAAVSDREDSGENATVSTTAGQEDAIEPEAPDQTIEWYWGSITSPKDFAAGAERLVGLVPAAYIELGPDLASIPPAMP
jgi:hypothetical protein